jgi:hypothetical protein
MHWETIATSIFAIVMGIIFIRALVSRRKVGPKKLVALYRHLHLMGIEASIVEESMSRDVVREKRLMGQKDGGTIRLQHGDIDSIDVVGSATERGARYYLDFLVRSTSPVGGERRIQTRMIKKRGSFLGLRIVDVEWRGDIALERKLNFDSRLKEKILITDLKPIKSGIQIIPENRNEYARIRTDYFLPTSEQFDILDSIARHIKSG